MAEEITDWVIAIKEELARASTEFQKWSICRVPGKLLSTSKDGYNAYGPQIISIGPLHHGNDKLKAMEDLKRQYLLSFLMRTSHAEETMDTIVRALPALDHKVRSYYAEPISFSNHELAKILLFDGCFILELFLRYSMVYDKRLHDPIFTNSWMISSLQRDLVLLENQIPFFVLEKLLEIIARYGATSAQSFSVLDLSLNFIKSFLNIDAENVLEFNKYKVRHFLHLIHIILLPTFRKVERRNKGEWRLQRTATALSEGRIKFVKDETKNLLDLKFHNGAFIIPTLRIYDSTDSLFRNLLAFEQCIQGISQYMTSYVILMDRLIDTRYDVELLEHEGIIENHLIDGEDVSDLFNYIGKQIHVDSHDFYFAGLCEQVHTYSRTQWPRYFAKSNRYMRTLRREYCSNPWTIISVIAASLLLALTITQTVYAVRSS